MLASRPHCVESNTINKFHQHKILGETQLMPERVKNLHGHESAKIRTRGSEDKCILCGQEIMFDGERWRSIYDIGTYLVRKWRAIYTIDKMTGRHA